MGVNYNAQYSSTTMFALLRYALIFKLETSLDGACLDLPLVGDDFGNDRAEICNKAYA